MHSLERDQDSLVASLGVLLSQKPYLAGGPTPAIVLLDILTSNQHAILLLVDSVSEMLVVELHGES